MTGKDFIEQRKALINRRIAKWEKIGDSEMIEYWKVRLEELLYLEGELDLI